MSEENELISIMVTSGTEDKLIALATIASGAVAMDYDVHIFLAFWGFHAFKKDSPDVLPVSPEGKDKEELMRKIMKEKNKPNWKQMLKQARELGNIKIVACSNMIDLFNVKEDELDHELVDEVAGIATYLDAATKAKTNLFI